MKRIAIVLSLLVLAVIFIGCDKDNTPAPGGDSANPPPPVTLNIGHVGHDHQTALYVALDRAADYAKATGLTIKPVEDLQRYELYENGTKIADLRIVKVKGGANMPTALGQEIIDIGFGGVAPTLCAYDSGMPVKLISPLHNKGDMFVISQSIDVNDWPGFVAYAKKAGKPIRIGYKSPLAVAKLIFEEALAAEGLTYCDGAATSDVNVQMINTNGEPNLNASLASGVIDGYAANNPWPATAVVKGIGKVVCDLETLPPGNFRNHPCCCIAANTKSLEAKSHAIEAMMMLFLLATDTIKDDLATAVASASRWTGMDEQIERMSIPTSGYCMDRTELWDQTMANWVKSLNTMGVFKKQLKDLPAEKMAECAYDLTLLNNAKTRLQHAAK